VTELFSITASDEGRPIADFAHQLDYEDLVKDAQDLLTNLAPIRREVASRSGRWYELRFRPYRTVDDKIDGVVITFVDISDRRKIEEAFSETERKIRQLKALIDLSREPIFVWDFDGGIIDWNRGCEELYGYARADAIGKRKEQLLRTEVPNSSFKALCQTLLEEGSWSGELRHKTKDGRTLTVESRLQLERLDRRRLVLESTRDITVRKTLEQRQQLLLNELAHRVKNTLSVVQSIAHQTLRTTTSVKDFVDRFSGRLSALSTAHSLLVQSDWKGADLGALARVQLEPYISENPDRLRIEGEPVSLAPDLATPFGLVLHELATNAAKYGSLREEHGTVCVSWTLTPGNDHNMLTVIWREQDGPPVKAPERTGFGTSLIERGIPNATVTREYRHDGLVCTIKLPLHETRDDGAVASG
jgi:two-component system CheB/CheR fusion protein